MRLLKAIALVIGLAAPALAGPYQGITVDATKGTATENLSGYLKVAASSVTATTPTVTIDGAAGSVSASSVTAKYGVIAATGAFSGAVSAGSFVGNVTGNASTASALLSAPSLAPSGFVSRGIDVSGNAQTAAVDSTVVAASTNPIQGGAVSTALALKLSLTGGSMSGAFNPAHKTIAQLQAISPTVGDQYTCSDCSPVLVVTATGTSAGNFNFSGGGSGGLASIQMSSGPVDSNGNPTNPNVLLSGTSIYANSAGLTLTQSGGALVLGVKNLTFVASTQTYIAAGTSLPSGSTFAGCQSTAPITVGNNGLWIAGSGSVNPNANLDSAYLWVLLDGHFLPGYGPTAAASNATASANTNNAPWAAPIGVGVAPVSAGLHQVCVGGAGNSGSATYYSPYQISVYELATGGAGYSVPASSATSIPCQVTTAQSAPGVAIATVTLSGLTSGRARIGYSGGWGNASLNGQVKLSVLQDGVALTPPLTQFDIQTGGHTENASSGFDFNVSTGTHSYALTPWNGDSTTMYSCGFTSAQGNAGTFYVAEIKNTAGSGDVSSNGKNVYSALNDFSSATVTGITRSSYTTSGFGSFTSGTTYSICLTTLTIPASGLNPVVVKFSGSAANSVGSAVGVNFLQDGQFVSPWTNAAGPAYGLTGFSAGVADLAFDVTIPAPSAGSHSYCLGTLVSGGTGSWSAAVKPQFKVYEEK